MSALLNTPAPDLASMTKAQLLAHAQETGVGGVSSAMTKAEIVAVIEAKRSWV